MASRASWLILTIFLMCSWLDFCQLFTKNKIWSVSKDETWKNYKGTENDEDYTYLGFPRKASLTSSVLGFPLNVESQMYTSFPDGLIDSFVQFITVGVGHPATKNSHFVQTSLKTETTPSLIDRDMKLFEAERYWKNGYRSKSISISLSTYINDIWHEVLILAAAKQESKIHISNILRVQAQLSG